MKIFAIITQWTRVISRGSTTATAFSRACTGMPVAQSKIEWTDATWNPIAGCTIISPGCTNCYAMKMAARCEAFGQAKYKGTTRKSGGRSRWTGAITLDRKALQAPYKWRKGKMIFVNSMSDLFHEDVPLSFIKEVFDVMSQTRQHTYQVLTKRADRLFDLSSALEWPENVWMGVSIESEEFLWRAERLRLTPARTKFLSLEPLLGPLPSLNLDGLDWIIVGGESGPGARPVDPVWVRSIRDKAANADVAFHFKQWGGAQKRRAGRELDGRTWDQFPKR